MLTSTTWGAKSDVYSSLTTASGNVNVDVAGLVPGMVVQTANTPHFRMLVQFDPAAASTTCAAYAAVKFKAGYTSSYIVQATSGAGDMALGVNDLAAVAIAAGQYFWITIQGPCTVLATTTISSQVMVNAGSSAGALSAASSTAANQQTNIVLQASSGSGGATAAYIF